MTLVSATGRDFARASKMRYPQIAARHAADRYSNGKPVCG